MSRTVLEVVLDARSFGHTPTAENQLMMLVHEAVAIGARDSAALREALRAVLLASVPVHEAAGRKFQPLTDAIDKARPLAWPEQVDGCASPERSGT